MTKINNAQPLSPTYSLSKTHIPVTLTFTAGELGKHGIPKEKLPKSIIVSERQIEEKSFKHFGLNDYEQIKARLKTEKNPFDAVKTSAKDGGAMLAYLDSKTGNYVVYLNIEKNLYRALTNKATELKNEIAKESRTAVVPKSEPFAIIRAVLIRPTGRDKN